jgi:hypothetical protein
MQIPAILQGESLTRLMQGAAVGAIATIVVGFYWGALRWRFDSCYIASFSVTSLSKIAHSYCAHPFV